MTKYNYEDLRKHWAGTTIDFAKNYADCGEVFDAIAAEASLAIGALVGRKALAPNCAYLLLAKSLNHSFATRVLLERGLIIDAALSCRNAVETLLLLELLAKAPKECERWAAGHEFGPAEVRKRLAAMPEVVVGDLVIKTPPESYEDARFAYGWLSKITHANLESLNFATTTGAENSFAIHIGGALSRAFVVAICTAIGNTYLQAVPTCIAVHAPSLFETHAVELKLLGEKLRAMRARG